MKKTLSQTTQISCYSNVSELPEKWQDLVAKSKEVLPSAYSKYSGFSVGAAVLLDDDTVVLGTNQENIAYPSGLCAERNALFSIGTNYPNHIIKAIAITASSIHGQVTTPVSPCGGCRQVMIECETKQNQAIPVIMSSQSEEVWVTDDVKTLVPFYFSSNEVGTANK